MDRLHIISGFSDIKSELISRLALTMKIEELILHFTFANDLLCAHNFNNHQQAIIIALKSNEAWTVRLDPRNFGYPLVKEQIQLKGDRAADNLNKLFDLFGFRRV